MDEAVVIVVDSITLTRGARSKVVPLKDKDGESIIYPWWKIEQWGLENWQGLGLIPEGHIEPREWPEAQRQRLSLNGLSHDMIPVVDPVKGSMMMHNRACARCFNERQAGLLAGKEFASHVPGGKRVKEKAHKLKRKIKRKASRNAVAGPV